MVVLKKLFGKNIKYYRFQNNMTQEQLAEFADLSARYISNIENGEGNVSLDTIEILAEILKVDYHELFLTNNNEIKLKKVNMKKEKVR